MPRGWEDLHVRADLGQDRLGGAPFEHRGMLASSSTAAAKGAICWSIASDSRSIC
jgi:hypothetical protein